LLNLLR